MSSPFLTKLILLWGYRRADLSEFCEPFEAEREQIAEGMLNVGKNLYIGRIGEHYYG